ncbi:MAG: Calx-beta domain-containing protein, partial [Candidatus Dormiibacterota bacterium]
IIQDDETTTAELLYEGDAGVVRGDSGTQFAEFTVTLALPSSSVVTFHYATTDVTAVAGTDYTAESGTATIPVGTTSAHIQVPILPDASTGPTLTFTISISASSGPVISRAMGTGTIYNWN